ncbi:MAG: succinate dehydrogenase [Proteobacteria bacterium]|nr:succinate dehydrogenase [Pseudomonadota bacterium]
MTETWLYALQRLTAILMLPMVVAHLATILYASSTGLTAEAILARTQSSPWIAVFYASFVVAASIHAPLGIRMILIEWGRASRRLAGGVAVLLCIVFLSLGMRGVFALTGGIA